MSKTNIIEKNIALTQKFTHFLIQNPEFSTNTPKSGKYVIFSAEDEELNKENQIIVEEMEKSGSKVLKVKEEKGSPAIFHFI